MLPTKCLEQELQERGCAFREKISGDFCNAPERKYLSLPAMNLIEDVIIVEQDHEETGKSLAMSSAFGNLGNVDFILAESVVLEFFGTGAGGTKDLEMQDKEIPCVMAGILKYQVSRLLQCPALSWSISGIGSRKSSELNA